MTNKTSIVVLALCTLLAFAGTGGAASGQTPGLPASTSSALVASYGSRAFVPSWVPPGYSYLRQRAGADLVLEFAHAGGDRLEWSVLTPANSSECRHPYPDRTRRLDGILVFFASGSHGADAWTCIGQGTAMYAVDAGDPHVLAPATLMHVVASATRVRGQLPAAPRGVPATYVGGFGSVDGRERCVVTEDAARCVSAVSGQVIAMTAFEGANYLGIGTIEPEDGPPMPEGTSFTTPSGQIHCSSGSYGIFCRDNGAVAFSIGDRYVRVIGADGSFRIPA